MNAHSAGAPGGGGRAAHLRPRPPSLTGRDNVINGLFPLTLADPRDEALAREGLEAELAALRARVTELEDENATYRDRLRLAGGAARIGIWDYDFERDELWVSDELCAIYGVPPGELTWDLFVERLHPDDRAPSLRRPTPSLPFGSVNEYLLRIRHTDGDYRLVRSRSVTIGRDGVPTRKLGAHIDMSSDTLPKLNDELAEANERLRQFTYTASHDLRSPLRALGHVFSFILEDHGPDLPAGVLELLATAEERVERMDRLVVDLLGYATADLADVGTEPCDIDRLLHDLARTVDRGGHRVEIRSEVGRPCAVPASPLGVCVRNLVDNACKHHDRSAGVVVVRAWLDGGRLAVSVADDGPGIPEAVRDRIFEPLVTTNPVRGSGMGLSHVDRLARRYGATLTVETEPGAGTRFTLSWPLCDGPDCRDDADGPGGSTTHRRVS